MIEGLQDQIKKAARSVAFQWPGVVDSDDVEQAIMLRLLESEGSIQKIRLMDSAGAYRAIVGIGHQLASRERTDYEHFSGNFRYSVGEVRALLESGILHDLGPGIKSSWSAEEYVSKGGGFEDAVLTKNSMETDLLRGLDRLKAVNSRYFEVISGRYLRDEVSDESSRQVLYRAVSSLANHMNRSFKRQHAERPDGPGTRTAISNASAHIRSSQQYGGEFGGYEQTLTFGRDQSRLPGQVI